MNRIDRREMLAALGLGAGLLGAGAARALPVLSPDNFGLTWDKVSRGNGWLEIDVAGYAANIARLRQLLGPQHQICAVMKGDGYGHSLALLIPAILRAGVTCIGITANDEARVARALGYQGRIARLRTATLDEVADGLPHHIEELTGNLAHARAMAALAARAGRELPIHFALNSTGMSRNGLDLSVPGAKEQALALVATPGLKVVGLMAHFPVEDQADVRASLARFITDTDWLFAAGRLDRATVQRHVANTFATLHVPEARLEMVRVGGALVGDTYDGFRQFEPIMTAKARVAAVNFYPAGSTVNYDRTWQLARDSWLANVPLGYADGYRRGFSQTNRPAPGPHPTFGLVHGRRAPLLGRVTMNTVMLDVTDFAGQVAMGDEVVFYGAQGPERITQAELEAASGTIGAEIYTILGNSLPRVAKPG